MIILFLLAITCASSADPNAAVYAVDGVEGLIYEIPEYEDPEVTQLRLMEMGAVPVLTILEVPEDSPEEENSEYYRQLAGVKKGLDKVFTLLYQARTKLERGNNHISVDLMRAIQDLKKLERGLRTDVHHFGTSVKQSVSFSTTSEGPKFKSDGEISYTSQTPIDSKDETSSDFKSTYEKKKVDLPFGESVIMEETKKISDGDKAALRKKWTWKTSV